MTPEQILKLNRSFISLMLDTQAVMSLRIMGMVGAIPAQSNENTRMVSEKGPAFAEAMSALTRAAFKGSRPDQIMSAGIAPLAREVSQNRKRLSK